MPPIDPNNPQIPTQVRPLPKAPAEPLQSTPYDFIMNPGTKPPKLAGGFKGGPKLMYIAGGGVLLVIALFVILSLTSGGSSSPGLTKVAQEQAEIARVADLHYSDIQDPATKNFVINAQLSAESAQADYLKFLSSNGVSVSTKQIALGIDLNTDTALDAAKTSGSLDPTVKNTIRTQLEHYQQTIQTTYNSLSSVETKALLKSFYEQATLLLEQSKS